MNRRLIAVRSNCFRTRRGTERGLGRIYSNKWPTLLAMSALILCVTNSPAQYSAVDLGTLGGDFSFAYAVNNSGQVAGYSSTTSAGIQHVFLYGGGTMADLGTLPGYTFGWGEAINNNGQVAGVSGNFVNPGPEVDKAFLYSGGTMISLGTLGGTFSFAYGINDGGQVVGMADTGGVRHAFLYSGGGMIDLGTLGGPESFAYDINNNGQVVGLSSTSNGNNRAFLYSGGTMIGLGTLGGPGSGAQAINDSGQITGAADTGHGEDAFLYSAGTMVDLGTLGGPDSWGMGINNKGQVVGGSYTSTKPGSHAFLFSAGTMSDLNGLVTNNMNTYLEEAFGINDSGQIIAEGANAHAYLLTAVPEPSSIVLVILGVVVFLRRRSQGL